MEGEPRGYFGADTGRRKKYYGVKRQIAFQRKFPLSQYSYAPLLRGAPLSLQTYGSSYKQATPEQRAARREFMMSGRGKYMMKGRGGFFGGLLGSMIPGVGYDKGSAWGDKAHTTIGQVGDALAGVGKQFFGGGLYKGTSPYSGRGAYATNNLVTDGGAVASSIVPVFNPSDMHSITYSNREFVRDIYAPTSGTVFTVQSWQLNPGLVTSFPWLSQIALNFEEYEFIQLCYTYKSTVADFASASGQVGQVAMATQYNPNSDAFADKEEMMLYEGGMSCKTTESLIHGIECDPAKLAGAPQKYVRAGNLPPSEDLKNYDLGRSSLAVLNVPSTYAGQQIGELWVSYTVKLRKPKLVSANAYNIRRDFFCQKNEGSTSLLGTNSLMNLSGTNLLSSSRNSLGCALTWANATAVPTGATTDLLTADAKTTNPDADQLQFNLTFPPDYSGIARVRIIMKTTAVTEIRAITSAVGTISRFQDIPMQSGSVIYWTHQQVQSTTAISDIELHLRILPVSNGIPNTIAFACRISGAPLTGPNLAFTNIEVCQYNSFLSISDSGSNDKLDLITYTGQQAAVW